MSLALPAPPGTLRRVRGFFRAGYRSAFAYRSNLLLGVIGMAVQVVLTVVVWRVVYSGHGAVAGISKTTAVAYAVLAASFQTIVMPWQFSSIPSRIRLGQIGVDMVRPVPLIAQSLAQATGTMVGRLPIGIAGIATGLALQGLQAPDGAVAGLAWVVSTAAGVANVLLINLAVSMVAFWTLDISGPMIVYRFGSAFLSGALIPLWFMPSWLRPVLDWLPFSAQMYDPLAIWFGTIHGTGIVSTLAIQLGWLVLLWLLITVIWRRAIYRVVVLGG